MDLSNICPNCQHPVSTDAYFCPNCGKALKEKPLSISITKQIIIYLVSFLLAPLGLGWGLKYIVKNDPKVRMVGIISILLTIISIALLFIIFKNFMDSYSKILQNPQNYTGY